MYMMIFPSLELVCKKNNDFTLKYRIWRFQGPFIEGSSSTWRQNTVFTKKPVKIRSKVLFWHKIISKLVFLLLVELEPSMKAPWNRQILFLTSNHLFFNKPYPKCKKSWLCLKFCDPKRVLSCQKKSTISPTCHYRFFRGIWNSSTWWV